MHHVSLDIRAGERLALVGPSGGGKTTLCNLIPRFYEVTGGRILIDGQDIQHVTLKSLREDIGIVQQDVYLFSGSVADNIAYGKPGATREEIIEAARLAGAERFIRALKDGFDTYVGERGVKLSGGQKQRIAIARVFLKNPPILILDEATSALDNESEILVGQSLEKLAHGRTTLTIAHRLTTRRASKSPAPTTSCWPRRASITACGTSCRGKIRYNFSIKTRDCLQQPLVFYSEKYQSPTMSRTAP